MNRRDIFGERSELIVKKWKAGLSQEEHDRLSHLNELADKIAPRYTFNDWQKLLEAAELLDEFEKRLT